MEHFITQIEIRELRHLRNIIIHLNNDKRQHLILTGKNGSGKTSVLKAIEKYCQALNQDALGALARYEQIFITGHNSSDQEKKTYSFYSKYYDGIHLSWNQENGLSKLFKSGSFITVFFPADRKVAMDQAKGVEDIKLSESYKVDEVPASKLVKYMVHLKTQQAYALNENDDIVKQNIDSWFERFEKALRTLLDDDNIRLEYDYKNYNFQIRQSDGRTSDFYTLSDGYASVIRIVSDIILRMDQNWLLNGTLSAYDKEGIVLIDELETHLHLELQRKILPFLTEFFPQLQFIITTHSPYILNSLDNALVYDLEKKMELRDASLYSSEDLAEGYFDSNEYSENLEKMLQRYRELAGKKQATNEERAERAELKMRLKAVPGELAPFIRDELNRVEEA